MTGPQGDVASPAADADVHAIVVLGHRLVSPDAHPELALRCGSAAGLYRELAKDRRAFVVATGGRTNASVADSEARVMARRLEALGVPPAEIHTEEEALDTLGNGFFSRPIIDRIAPASTVHVVTSCYHAPRAAYVFRMTFGLDRRVLSRRCAPFPGSDAAAEEHRFDAARRFFRGIAPGDMHAIGERLATEHDLYRR